MTRSAWLRACSNRCSSVRRQGSFQLTSGRRAPWAGKSASRKMSQCGGRIRCHMSGTWLCSWATGRALKPSRLSPATSVDLPAALTPTILTRSLCIWPPPLAVRNSYTAIQMGSETLNRKRNLHPANLLFSLMRSHLDDQDGRVIARPPLIQRQRRFQNTVRNLLRAAHPH